MELIEFINKTEHKSILVWQYVLVRLILWWPYCSHLDAEEQLHGSVYCLSTKHLLMLEHMYTDPHL